MDEISFYLMRYGMYAVYTRCMGVRRRCDGVRDDETDGCEAAAAAAAAAQLKRLRCGGEMNDLAKRAFMGRHLPSARSAMSLTGVVGED